MQAEKYLCQFGDISKLDRNILLTEIDAVWDQLELNNNKRISEQSEKISQFYSHNVWILNGLFSESDPVSRQHREAIADYLKALSIKKIADYGGGSGVLAKFIAQKMPEADIDIVEPYPSVFFKERVQEFINIKFVPELQSIYDAVIAQDVLEHIDNPLEVALSLVCKVKTGGYVIFANSFYPVIKCHLPATFYLRHQFKKIMTSAGLQFVENISDAEHAFVFKRIGEIDYKKVGQANFRAKILGPVFNLIISTLHKFRNLSRNYASF